MTALSPTPTMLNYLQEMDAKKEKSRNVRTWMILKSPVVVHFNPFSRFFHWLLKRGRIGKWMFSENLNDQFEISFGLIFSPYCGIQVFTMSNVARK